MMKLLSLDTTYRRWLYSRNALTFDYDLNEVFVGLTLDDSIDYAENSESPLTASRLVDVDELIRFLALHERHELALAFRDEDLRFQERHSSPPHTTPAAHRP